MVIINDIEWPMLSYYVIYYEKFKKVMQQTEKEAFNCISVKYHFDFDNIWWALAEALMTYMIIHVCDLRLSTLLEPPANS